ncbi:MAG TPA: imidazole glycerol phosphate synthase subunit HisH [Bacteroidia bacterium]|nr:imidazole glycerol phosphate synthase subunit HisH [Bacteroidia bacterium]
MKIAIIDYNSGNTQSVICAMDRIGIHAFVTDDHDDIRAADKVIFPGVGEAASAMKAVKEKKLDTLVLSLKQPVLGICLGMQLMCRHSEEGNTDCLGIFETQVKKIPAKDDLKIPHMGWNTISGLKGPLYKGVPGNVHVYFVHSYCADLCAETNAVTDYSVRFSAGLSKNNFHGVQFHPEKSGVAGEFILRNFISL